MSSAQGLKPGSKGLGWDWAELGCWKLDWSDLLQAWGMGTLSWVLPGRTRSLRTLEARLVCPWRRVTGQSTDGSAGMWWGS